jgi:hypothetical protein
VTLAPKIFGGSPLEFEADVALGQDNDLKGFKITEVKYDLFLKNHKDFLRGRKTERQKPWIF